MTDSPFADIPKKLSVNSDGERIDDSNENEDRFAVQFQEEVEADVKAIEADVKAIEKKVEGVSEAVKDFHLTDTTILAKLRKAFAFKLFRLIKAWLAGTAIFLIFVTVHNQMIAALLVLSVFLGICASLLNDKFYEFRTEKKFGQVQNLL